MAEVFHTSAWDIELPTGWTVEHRSDHMWIRLPDARAELRITPFNDQTGQLTAEQWLHVTEHFSRKRDRPVISRRCGDFEGHETAFASAQTWIRSWALIAGGVGLDVNYRCPRPDAGRDDSVIDAVLATLRLRRAAT